MDFKQFSSALAVVGLAAFANSAQASVTAFSAHSLQVKHEVSISAPASTVYETLLSKVSSWWNPSHTYTGDGKNLSIEARPGGCFCEKFPAGGGIEHLRVVYLAPNKAIRFQGALGPFQGSGVAGSLTWKLSEEAGKTKLELVYSFGGFMDGSFEKIAPAADAMLGDQINRLKLFVETGKPVAEGK